MKFEINKYFNIFTMCINFDKEALNKVYKFVKMD